MRSTESFNNFVCDVHTGKPRRQWPVSGKVVERQRYFRMYCGGCGERAFEVASGKRQERWPVWAWRMSAAVLANGNVTSDERSLKGRKFGGPQVFLAQELICRSCGSGGHEHALGIDPTVAVGGAGTNKDRP